MYTSGIRQEIWHGYFGVYMWLIQFDIEVIWDRKAVTLSRVEQKREKKIKGVEKETTGLNCSV